MAERTSKHRTIAVDVDAKAPVKRSPVNLPWYLVAAIGALGVAALGWLVVAGPAALGWLTSPRSQFGPALTLATRLLLLAHGAPVEIGRQHVTLIPLGLTLLLILFGRPVGVLATRQAIRNQDPASPQMIAVRAVGIASVSYAAMIAGLGAAFAGVSAWRGFLGALVVGLFGTGWGAYSTVREALAWPVPVWLRKLPHALAAAMWSCLAAGALLLTVALFRQRDRIAGIVDSLHTGHAGAVLLVFLQLLFLPNLVVWATAWTLGAGLTFGDGSLVSMGITDVGFLPAIPVFGALPAEGPVSGLAWLWLLGGVAAGALAGTLAARARPARRFDETTLLGGLCGVAAGLIIVALAWVASGGLGTQRLARLGVRLGDLAITAPSILGLAGLLAGLVVGLVRRQWPSREQRAALRGGEESFDEETTRQRHPADESETLPRPKRQ